MIYKKVLSAILCAVMSSWVAAQERTEGADPAMSAGQADAILGELRQIRVLLQRMERRQKNRGPAGARRQAPPQRVRVSVVDRPMLGEPDAPITIVEFVDYECPYCLRFFQGTYPRIKSEYLDPGKVKLVVKDMPLGFHKLARGASQASHCAGEQGRYFAMHDALFNGEGGLNPGAIERYAVDLSLDMEAFRACLAGGRHLVAIDADIAEAQAAGISGTPAFIVGRQDGDHVEGVYVRGALPFPVFKSHIDKLLNERQ